MINVASTVHQFVGSHYDFGVFQGNLLKQNDRFPAYIEKRAQLLKKYRVNSDEITTLYQKFAPALLQEIRGLQHSLELTDEIAFLLFSGFFANNISGCSIILNSSYLVRNYDQEPSTYDGRYVLYKPTDGGYASIGPSMLITGRTDGMNEHGLSIGYNFVNSKQHQDGFVCNMIARIVLETCQSIDEAITLLNAIPHKHSFNYCLVDGNGQTIIVEASPRGVKTRQSFVCTNHFHELVKENRYTMKDSLRREELLVKHALTSWMNDYALLNELEHGIYATKYGAWDGTIHTSVYLPKEKIAFISFKPNQQPFPFRFNDWLTGTPLYVKRLNGQLAANFPFALQQKEK